MKKLLSLILVLAIITSTIAVPVSAVESDYSLVANSVVLDGTNPGTVDVKWVTTAGGPFYTIQAVWDTHESDTEYFTLQSLSSTSIGANDAIVGAFTQDNNVETGAVYYSDASFLGYYTLPAGSAIWTATYSVAPDTPVGNYDIGLHIEVVTGGTSGTTDMNDIDLQTKVNVSKAALQTDPYEIYYTLGGSTYNGTSDNDTYTNYNIGDTVNATIYIKNTGDSAVNLQAYDIYLTYDSKLTCGTFTPEKDVVGRKISDANGQARIQAVGKNVSDNADINILLPADGTGVELGTIAFTMNSDVEYNEGLEITLLPGSAEEGDSSTNIGVGYNENGDKNSYYPSVTADVLGAEVMTKYDVTFDSNGGSDVATQSIGYNLTATKPADPIKANYSFDGWYADEELTNEFEFATKIIKDTTVYAKWKQDTFTVKWYDANGDEITSETKTVNAGSTLNVTTVKPEKTDTVEWDYTFDGWNTEENAAEKMNLTDFKVNENLEFYPVYTQVKQKYTVTWFNHDGTQLHKDESVEYGTTPVYDGQTPTKEDSSDGQFKYTHDGWSETKNGTKLETLPTVDGNETYYAVFTESTKSYTVNYAAGEGSFADGTTTEVTVEYGENPTNVPTPTTPDGYIFSGWSDNTSTYKTDLTDYIVKSDVTLTAQYAPAPYIITLNPDGGSITDANWQASGNNYTMSYDITSTKTLPTPTKIGYAFDGWLLSADKDGWDANTYGANTSVTGKWGDVTLVAQWSEDKHEVKQSSDVQNGTATPGVNSAKEGDTVTVTVTPAEGYEFGDEDTVTYNYTDADGKQQTEKIPVTDDDDDGTYIGSFSMPDSVVEITATFTAIDYAVTVTVTPSGTATVTPNKASANINDEITLTASDIKDGYELSKYEAVNVSTNQTIAVNEGKFMMPAADVNVTATFTGKTYKIVYNPNGGENTMSNGAGTFGTETTLTSNAFAKTGYRFAGWTTTEGSTEVEYGNNAKFNPTLYAESYSLYAVWTANEYTVTLDYNYEGAVDSSIEVAYDSTYYSKLTDPSRTGYTFDGWYDAESDGTKVESSTIMNKTENHTLYAHWTAKPVTVTLDYNYEGAVDSSIEVAYDSTYYSKLTDPSRTGYTFLGWFDKETNNKIVADTVVKNENAHTLCAQWDINTYTITFELDGGTLSTGVSNPMNYNITSTDELPTPTKNNYVFNGWKVKDTVGSWIKDDVYGPATTKLNNSHGNVTLTAQWTGRSDAVVEEYKYAANGYVMLFVADDLGTGKVYQFGTGENAVTMYYTTAPEYLSSVNGAAGVFYTLISADYAEKNGEAYTGKLNDAGLALLNKVDGDKTSEEYEIKYEGYINGDDVVNIADANVVYQMIINGGGYYGDLDTQYRLGADMNKENIDSSTKRATVDDVHRIVGIINGTT